MTTAATHLSIRLLGQFEVAIGDRQVGAESWPSRRSAELVQLLALSDGYRLPRDRVIDALWRELEPTAGSANLRKAAHHARRALGHRDAVTLKGGVVFLNPGGVVDSDVARFESAARTALRDGNAELAREAASRYGGILLPESLYEEWTEGPRVRLESLYAEVLTLGEQWAQLVQIDPVDETAYRELIREALRRRNRPAAIRWYGRLRTVLAAELGIAPSPETEALYQQCISGLQPAAPALVGRQPELARVAAALGGDHQGIDVVAVRGPAGIGKSALLRGVATVAEQRGWETLTVQRSQPAEAYGPLITAIDQLTRRDRSPLESIGAKARSMLAELSASAAPALPLEGPITSYRTVGAFRQLFEAYAGRSGLLVVVDDAHSLDSATVDVLLSLGGSRDGTPVSVLLAYRGEAADPALIEGMARARRSDRLLELDLGPLDREQAAALVSAEAPAPLAPPVLEQIVDLAEGNPLFLRELVRSVAADGELSIEPTVWDAISTRFVDLDSGSVEMLRRLALAGDDFDTAYVLALTGLPEQEAFALLDTALARGVLVVDDARYRFRHALVRQALAQIAPPHVRQAVHRDAARRLALARAPATLIARHWLEGGRPDDAVPWLLASARRAIRLGAFADALRSLDALLEHQPGHTQALIARADALDALGDVHALAAYAEAASHASEDEAREIRPRQALAQLKAGDPEGALQTLQSASPRTTSARIYRALTISGAAAIGFGDPASAAAEAAEARRLALESGDPGAIVEASWAQSLAAHACEELPTRLRADLVATRELPDLAIRVFDGHLCATERLLYGARPYAEVMAFASSLAAEAERLGAGRGQAFACTLRGEAALLSGELAEARGDLSAGIELHRTIGAPAGEALGLQRLAEVAMYEGRREEAAPLLEQALVAARESYLGHHLLDRIYGARIAAARGAREALAMLDEAEHTIRGPYESCPACRITLVVPAAIAAARCGDLERASRYAREGDTLVDIILRLPAWSAAMDEVQGSLARAAGDATAAAERFSRAHETYGRCGQPLDRERCARLMRATSRG